MFIITEGDLLEALYKPKVLTTAIKGILNRSNIDIYLPEKRSSSLGFDVFLSASFLKQI